jgi:hypothetical protein
MGLHKTAVADGRVAEAVGGGGTDDDDLKRLDSLRRCFDWTTERRLSAIWEKYGIRGYGVRGVRCAESFDIKFWRPWELRSY